MSPEQNDQKKDEALHDALVDKIKSSGEIGEEEKGYTPPSPFKILTENILGTRLTLLKPNLDDMAAFSRQLATLITVGIPLVRSLKILTEHTQHPRLKSVAGKVTQNVEEGQTLSSSLATIES